MCGFNVYSVHYELVFLPPSLRIQPRSFLSAKSVSRSDSTILHFFALVIFGLMTGRICLTYDESVLDDFYFIGAESLESGKLVSA